MTMPDISSVFSPNLAPFISKLLREARVGICRGQPRISDVNTGTSEINDTLMDRFKLVLPHAGSSVTWEIMFNSHYPDEPPDIIFEEADFVPDITKLQSLLNWNAKDSTALLKLVDELLEEYRCYQQNLVDKSSRLKFEHSSLLENEFKPEDIEIHATKIDMNRLGPVNFLINLQTDFSRIPAYMHQDSPGEDVAVLMVTFQNPDDSKLTPQLYLSPRVEHVLGGSESLRIPVFPTGGCLIDYIPSVSELLNNKVDQVVSGYEKRRECISAFLSLIGMSVIEYDSEAFTSASFIFEWNDFFFCLAVELPKGFPKDSPVYRFQSVYHETEGGQPYSKVIKDAPFSPRWGGNTIADRARTYLLECIPNFQRDSVKEGSL